jgi:acetyl esterase/lipase
VLDEVRDLSYRPDRNDSGVDVYSPRDRHGLPVIVLVHGGGLIGGERAWLTEIARSLARSGFVVFNVDYSVDPALGPAFPREVDDVMAATTWARLHASEHGGDARRLALVGPSAGGYLAAMAGLLLNRSEVVVSAVVSLSGPMDVATFPGIIPADCTGDCAAPSGSGPTPNELVGCPTTGCAEARLQAASPIDQIRAHPPAFFLANSTHEKIPLDQATTMAHALRSAGGLVELRVVEGRGHGTDYLDEVAADCLAFLRAHTAAPVEPTGTSHLRLLVPLLVLLVPAALVTGGGAARRRRDRRSSYA